MGESGGTSIRDKVLEEMLDRDFLNQGPITHTTVGVTRKWAQGYRHGAARTASENYTPKNMFSRLYQRIKNIKNYFIR